MKKKFKFQVKFHLQELVSVPFVNGALFAKIRLLHGGKFVAFSQREEIRNHSVSWQSEYEFSCKISANEETGILENCCCRVSIRKEIRGGQKCQKLGYVDLNLSEFTGGKTARRFLLEGYDSSHRQSNSILKVDVRLSLISGDPVFKAPIPEVTLRDRSHNSNVAESSKNLTWHGRVSATGKTPISPNRVRAHGSLDMANLAANIKETGSSSVHGRTDSDISRNSGSSSSNNSRSRRDSDNSSGSGEHEQRKGYYGKQQYRTSGLYDSRINADDVVNEIINSHDFSAESNASDRTNLELVVSGGVAMVK